MQTINRCLFDGLCDSDVGNMGDILDKIDEIVNWINSFEDGFKKGCNNKAFDDVIEAFNEQWGK